MSRKTKYARVAITIPEQDLAAADELARDRDRSRSWIISEAVREYIARPPAEMNSRYSPPRREPEDKPSAQRVIGCDRVDRRHRGGGAPAPPPLVR